MDRKVLFGLVALAAAAALLRKGGSRRSFGLGGLGKAPRGWKPKNKKAWAKGTRIEQREPNYYARSVGGLGLIDTEHGMKRVYHAVQAGFLQKDAVRFARRGWCDQAFKKLREAEYETGQSSGHAKSVTGALQVAQQAKGKASRLGMNKATDEVKKSCATHKKRAPRVRGQGDLPF
jgi:cellobiose-specific phosphotransferase system component IIA